MLWVVSKSFRCGNQPKFIQVLKTLGLGFTELKRNVYVRLCKYTDIYNMYIYNIYKNIDTYISYII